MALPMITLIQKYPHWISPTGERKYVSRVPEACCQDKSVPSHGSCNMHSGDVQGMEVERFEKFLHTDRHLHITSTCCTRIYKMSSHGDGVCIGHGPWFKRKVMARNYSNAPVAMVLPWLDQAKADVHASFADMSVPSAAEPEQPM